MPFDYEANIAAIRNVLANANTTTATVDLSSGLTRRVQSIVTDDPSVVSLARGDNYPIVFVKAQSKDESFAFLGTTGPARNRKDATVRYQITGVYRKDGGRSAHSGVLTEIYRLAENIEGVFQQEPTASDTAILVNPVSTEFGSPADSEGVWFKAVEVTLEARYLFR